MAPQMRRSHAADRTDACKRTGLVPSLWTVLFAALFLVLAGALGATGRAPFPRPDTSAPPAEPNPASFPAMLREGRADAVILESLGWIELEPAATAPYLWMLRAFEQERLPAVETATIRAVQSFERLLRVYPGNARLRHALGAAYLRLGEFSRARDEFKSAIAAGAAFWEPYDDLVNAYLNDKDIEDASEFLADRLALRPDDPFLLHAVGQLRYHASRHRSAIAPLNEARSLFRAANMKAEEVRCLHDMSDNFTYLNDYPAALDTANEALRLARILGDKLLEAQCLERTAFVRADLGRGPQSFADCSRALSLAREAASRKLEILCSRTMGVVLLNRGDLAGAEEYLAKALAYYHAAQALRPESICLYWLTLLLRDRGDYASAMSRAHEALGLSRVLGFKTGEAFDLTALGDIHLALGNYDRALAFDREALAVAEKDVGKWSREECLNTIGSVCMEVGDYRQALASYEDALRYIEEIGHGRERARCLYNVGSAYFKLGDLAAAAAFFEKSLASARSGGDKIAAAFAENRLGDLYLRRGLSAEAEAAYLDAGDAGRSLGQPTVIWQTFAGLGALRAARGDVSGAIESYKRAVSVIEDLRVQLLLREYSSGYFQSKVSLYEALVGLLYERAEAAGDAGLLAECLYYAEKAKARSFLDDLQKARVETKTLPPARAREIEVLSRDISRLSAELSQGGGGESERASLLKELDQAEDDYQILVAKARAANPNYARALASEPCRIAEIRRILPDRTGLVEYLAGDSSLFVFVLTRERLIVRRTPSPECGRVFRLAEDFARLVSSRDTTNADVVVPGERLYEALLGVAGADAFAGLENIVIVPDGTLNNLPFEALVSRPAKGAAGGRPHFLIEDYGITYAPSASTLVSVLERGRAPGPRRDLAAIGDPLAASARTGAGSGDAGHDMLFEYYRDRRFALQPLPFASREIEAIARLISPESRLVVTREKATESLVKRLPLSDFRIIHFATHSLLDEGAAGRSALVLTREPWPGEDGFLEAREIYDMRLDADLVVLSACQTAAGKMEKGEGIEGLARAFICAGSRSVLASLWNVSDVSTSEFMRSFYDFLTKGKTKQEALRLTKIRSSRSRPFHWAPFILMGEGDAGVALHSAPWWRRALHL